MIYYQFNLFEDFSQNETASAINCLTKEEVIAESPAEWMLKLVPNGDYAIKLGKHSMILKKLKSAAAKIPAGLEYCHYLIDGWPYFGTFVGA